MSDNQQERLDAPYQPSALLDEEGVQYVSQFLSTEIKDVLSGGDRQKFLDGIEKYRRMRMLQPEQEQKSYPWQKASNLVTPIMAQKTNVIYAKLVSMFSTKRPFWSCITQVRELEPQADAIAKYMNHLAKGPFHLNIDNVNRTLFYDLVSLGTQVVRVPWLYEEWQMKAPSGTGTELVSQKRVIHNGPALVPVRLEDFLCRSYYEDIQRAPWVGFRNWLTYAELKQREQMGVYENVDQVEDFYAQTLPEDRKDEYQRRGFESSSMGSTDETKLYPIIEAFVFYDADGDGVPEDIKVWIEVESGVILRSEANMLGVRDAQILRYFKLPGQLYGMGVGHLLEGLQEEADFLHNHRIDNLHLSLMPIYKRRTGSMQAKRKELHPGAILDMDDTNDLQPLVTPDLTGSSFASENLVRDYADRISGANDPMSGYADPVMKSGSDVGSTMFLAQQGNSILNAVYDGIENDYNGIGQLVLMQCVANKDKIDLSALDPMDAALVQQVLAMPLETLPTTFKFAMETTDISRTEETKRNNIMQAAGLYTQYGQQMLQLLPIALNPQVPPQVQQFAMQLFSGATELTRQALDFFHITGGDKLLPPQGAMNANQGTVPAGAGGPGPATEPAVNGAPPGPGAGGEGMAPGMGLA